MRMKMKRTPPWQAVSAPPVLQTSAQESQLFMGSAILEQLFILRHLVSAVRVFATCICC